MKKKKQNRYTVNQEAVKFVRSIVPTDREICDMKLEGKWFLVILDTGLRLKVCNTR